MKNKKVKEYHMIADSGLGNFNHTIQVHLDNGWRLSGKTLVTIVNNDKGYKPIFIYHQLVVR